MMTAVRTTGLTRAFGTLVAVDHVDLGLAAGEVYGLLGRNGAGKTTLIRMVLGLIRPTAGSVEILGHGVGTRGDEQVWAQVGYLVEGPGLYPELTVTDHLAVAAAYRGLGAGALDAVVERLSLGGQLPVRARHLSLGNRQRLALALALVHSPAVVVLDEPGNGLDPAGVVEVRDLLRDLADAGAAVLMSSHLVAEVARVADRVGILHEGRLVDELDTGRLAALDAGRVRITLPDPRRAPEAQRVLAAAGFAVVDHDGYLDCDQPDAVAHPEDLATALVLAGVPPRSLVVSHQDLEQHFLALTEAGGA
ncbi:MAG TPA: ABC transporter ATP-binding protein [Actinotalea sp.]